MLLSNSGRIVVVDDDAKEVNPLLATLSKMGAPYCYFSGALSDLPEKPLLGVRFVFLDIEIAGFAGLMFNEDALASALASVLSKIISSENGPYVIVFWTKHHEIIKHVLLHCKRAKISPIAHVDLDKIECKQKNYSNLPEAICNKLKDIGALMAQVKWENIVHSASSEFFRKFSALTNASEDWSLQIGGILNALSEAELGEKETDGKLKFKSAFRLLNQSFFDVLQRYTMDGLVCPDGFLLQETRLDQQVIAQINNWLFLDMTSSVSIKTGYVYSCKRDACIESIIGSLENKGDTSTWTPVEVVITAECDIACKKTLKIPKASDEKPVLIHRVVKGVITPYDAIVKRDGDARTTIGPFLIKEKVCKICLHLGATTLQHENEFGAYYFRLNRSLVSDIQAKASNYLNRLGNGVIKGYTG